MNWTVRSARPDDYAEISAVVDAWWGGRQMAGLLQPLFLENFSSTSFVAESDAGVVGFLIGFASSDDPHVAYIHFAGVAPDARGAGLGRELYTRFAVQMATLGARRLRCVTSIVNESSVAFHRAIGFEVTGHTRNEDVDGGEYVQLERAIETVESPMARTPHWPPSPTTTLLGRAVSLQPTSVPDATDLYHSLDDEEVWRHVPTPRPLSVTEMEGIVRELRSSKFPWTVRLTAPVNHVPVGSVVGWSSYLDWSASNARIEIGNTIYARGVWGSVVNAEVKLLLLGHAFDDMGFGRVQLKTDIKNVRSQDAIARLGAQREGVLRHYQRRRDGTIRDSVLYSITADEWPEVKRLLKQRVAKAGTES